MHSANGIVQAWHSSSLHLKSNPSARPFLTFEVKLLVNLQVPSAAGDVLHDHEGAVLALQESQGRESTDGGSDRRKGGGAQGCRVQPCSFRKDRACMQPTVRPLSLISKRPQKRLSIASGCVCTCSTKLYIGEVEQRFE